MRGCERRGTRQGASHVGLAVLLSALAGCVTLDEIETPNGDIDLSPDESGEGVGGAPAARPGDGGCEAQGWAFVRVAGQNQLEAWSPPDLIPSCGAAPHRLTALAPRIGSALLVRVSSSTGRVVEATYSTTRTGADGEAWGEYVAPIEVSSVRFGPTNTPTQQPFDFAGSILGPFGPVSIAASGCARVRPSGC